MNLYQHVKNETVSLICYGKIVLLKILHSDWLNTFWLISQEQDFSQQKDLCSTNSVKVNGQILL